MNTPVQDFNAVYNNPSAAPRPLMSSRQLNNSVGMAGNQTAASQMGQMAGSPAAVPQAPSQTYAFPGNGDSASLPLTDINQPQPITTESLQYLNGFLRTQIGNRVKVEFLIGTNTYLDKSGLLVAVGANYIILQEAMSDDFIVCDFFNIKFITIFR